jgi:hypothetical protein
MSTRETRHPISGQAADSRCSGTHRCPSGRGGDIHSRCMHRGPDGLARVRRAGLAAANRNHHEQRVARDETDDARDRDSSRWRSC